LDATGFEADTCRGIKAGPRMDPGPTGCAYPRPRKSRDGRTSQPRQPTHDDPADLAAGEYRCRPTPATDLSCRRRTPIAWSSSAGRHRTQRRSCPIWRLERKSRSLLPSSSATVSAYPAEAAYSIVFSTIRPDPHGACWVTANRAISRRRSAPFPIRGRGRRGGRFSIVRPKQSVGRSDNPAAEERCARRGTESVCFSSAGVQGAARRRIRVAGEADQSPGKTGLDHVSVRNCSPARRWDVVRR
jgi:hypothetical protein